MDKKRKNHRKITWKTIKENKKILLICLIILVLAIYSIYKVVILVQNPTDTFTVEQGKIYQEESTTRIYYSRRNSSKRF